MEDVDLPEDVVRSPDEIARRALVLSIVVSVAYGSLRSDALAWLRQEELLSLLTPREEKFLSAADPTSQEKIDFTWMIERLVPLTWAIQKLDRLPPLTSQCDPDLLKDAVVWPPQSTAEYIRTTRFRVEEEIHARYEEIYHAHWRVRDAQLRGLPPSDGLDRGSIYERHYGFNWVIGYCSQEWDEISTDT
jgi:hypothetical protein